MIDARWNQQCTEWLKQILLTWDVLLCVTKRQMYKQEPPCRNKSKHRHTQTPFNRLSSPGHRELGQRSPPTRKNTEQDVFRGWIPFPTPNWQGQKTLMAEINGWAIATINNIQISFPPNSQTLNLFYERVNFSLFRTKFQRVRTCYS